MRERGAAPRLEGLVVAAVFSLCGACGDSTPASADAVVDPEPEKAATIEPEEPIAPVATTNPIRRNAPVGAPPAYVEEELPPPPPPPPAKAVTKARKAKASATPAKAAPPAPEPAGPPVDPTLQEPVVIETLPPEPEEGMLSVGIVGGGWAEVFLDGARLDQTAPLRDYPIPVGHHTVRVANDNGIDFRQEIDVTPGGTIKITARP